MTARQLRDAYQLRAGPTRERAQRAKKKWALSGRRMAGPYIVCVMCGEKGGRVDTLCLLGWRKGVRRVFGCGGDKDI